MKPRSAAYATGRWRLLLEHRQRIRFEKSPLPMRAAGRITRELFPVNPGGGRKINYETTFLCPGRRTTSQSALGHTVSTATFPRVSRSISIAKNSLHGLHPYMTLRRCGHDVLHRAANSTRSGTGISSRYDLRSMRYTITAQLVSVNNRTGNYKNPQQIAGCAPWT